MKWCIHTGRRTTTKKTVDKSVIVVCKKIIPNILLYISNELESIFSDVRCPCTRNVIKVTKRSTISGIFAPTRSKSSFNDYLTGRKYNQFVDITKKDHRSANFWFVRSATYMNTDKSFLLTRNKKVALKYIYIYIYAFASPCM